MGKFGKSTRARLMISAAAGAIVISTSPAFAQETPRIELAPQSLASALYEFGRQTGRQVIFSPELTNSKTTQGVSGSADEQLAMSELLAGTDLTYRREGNTFLITRADADPQSGSAAGDGADGTVEALIVTAQKREEDIQDVPIAISAFTQETLERSQVAGGPDLITQVPNMTFTKTNFTGYSIQIRGIGTQAISATTDAAVAVAFNNTPFIRNRFFEQEFYDLQRVEVLRGPQGTLYGRNATAGVVNLISQKPKFNFEAKVSADISNYSSTRLEGMVNIPIVEDTVAVRLAGAWTKRDGYATNELTGNSIDGRDLWSTRLSLRFSPSDRLDANLIWEHFEEDDDRLRSGKQLCKKHVVTHVNGVDVAPWDSSFGGGLSGGPVGFASIQPTFSQGCLRNSLYAEDSFQTPNGASVPYYLPTGAIGLPVALGDPYVRLYQTRDLRMIESTIDPQYRAKSDLAEFQISFDITDTLTLASETAYSTDSVYSLQDFNRFNTAPGAWRTSGGGGPSALIAGGVLSPEGVFCDPQLGCSDRLVAVDVSSAKSRNFSQEFRLSSDFDRAFNFSLGANFLRYDTEDKYYVFINSLTLTALANNAANVPYSPEHPYIPGESDNSSCLQDGLRPGDPLGGFGYYCVYVEPNSIESIQDRGHNYFLSKNPYKLISYAVFGEAYYDITDNLKITAGVRWTVDKKEAPRVPSWTLAGESVGYPVLDVTELEWSEPTGRLALDWKPDLAFTDETLLYASYAHGYKAGGANPPPLTPIAQSAEFYGGVHISESRPKTFDAEFVDAFELGAKNTLFDGTVTLNLAGFYYDYRGYQVSEIVDRSAFNRNFDATIWGLEIEADWRPLENLKLGLKGGYENTRIADGERVIDLMDRTAGKDDDGDGIPDWVVVRPFPTFASSCILPAWLFSPEPGTLKHLGNLAGGTAGGCEFAYLAHYDPVTGLPYVADPTEGGGGATFEIGLGWDETNYPGWDPLTAPNNGEGFFKDVSGNHLPNAPEFTGTFTVDYTIPLPNEWLTTLHTDLYWQSESWWRVFDDHEYNRLDPYFTMNMAAIFTNEERGWRVMAYVKNVFDRESITGAFLNSDDTGLTTNVFLTEPRLYGLRVTKAWTGGPLLGSFGERRDGPYPFTVEIGGQVQRHEAPNAAIVPSFMDEFSQALNPLHEQAVDLDWGDGRDVKFTYDPGSWKLSAAVRYGETNGSTPYSSRQELGDSICLFLCPGYGATRYNTSTSNVADREEHTLVDFTIGKDIGFGFTDESAVAVGLRYADVGSSTNVHIFGLTNWDIPSDDGLFKYPLKLGHHDEFDGKITAEREFQGAGPVLSWEASKALIGDDTVGVLGLDWALAGGVLFGERTTSITGEEVAEEFTDVLQVVPVNLLAPDTTVTTPVSIQRSEDVTVPTFGASLGLSYKVDRFSIGAGYRWERYQDAIDGGYDEAQEEDRTIDGPYFKLSVGFGG